MAAAAARWGSLTTRRPPTAAGRRRGCGRRLLGRRRFRLGGEGRACVGDQRRGAGEVLADGHDGERQAQRRPPLTLAGRLRGPGELGPQLLPRTRPVHEGRGGLVRRIEHQQTGGELLGAVPLRTPERRARGGGELGRERITLSLHRAAAVERQAQVSGRDRLQHRERARGVAGGEPLTGLRELGADGLHARLLLRARGLVGRERAPCLLLEGARVAIVDEEDLRRGELADGLRIRVSLERVHAARVVRGADPHQATEHHGDRDQHDNHAHDDPTTPHRGVVVAPVLGFRVPPPLGQLLQLQRSGRRSRRALRRPVHILTAMCGLRRRRDHIPVHVPDLAFDLRHDHFPTSMPGET